MAHQTHSEHYPWLYKFDGSCKVWRGFNGDLEVNQYDKLERMFVMGHQNDPVTWAELTLTRVPVLTPEERQKFIGE